MTRRPESRPALTLDGDGGGPGFVRTYDVVVFARVITAQAGPAGFDAVRRLAEQQLPKARSMPGFSGYQLLTNEASGEVMIVSLWTTRQEMDAVTAAADRDGVHTPGVADTGLTSVRLTTYEVPVHN